jgi:putative thioredoxin
MAGAVDLSALKQRATQPADAGRGPGAQAGVEITETNFETEVLARSSEAPVVVAMWSPRSDVSVELVDALAGLASADQGKWSLATVNVDAAPGVAQAIGVQAVPTVVAVAAGRPVDSFQGAPAPEQLRDWIDALVHATAGKLDGTANSEPEQVDPGLAKARELLDAGNSDAALGAYRAILDDDPAHPEAKAVVRLLGFQTRAARQPSDAIEAADAAPDDIDAAFAAADVEILNRQVEQAFNRLIALVRRTSGDDRTKVRTQLIELFELFEPSDPAVIAGRRNLANALY